MLRLNYKKGRKQKFNDAKKPIKILHVNVKNVAIQIQLKQGTVLKYLIGYLDEVIRPLVLILPKTSGLVKTFKDKGGDKNKKNKLISLRLDDNKLLDKYKTICTKIED